MMKVCIINPQNIGFYIGNLKNNNRKIKLDALSAIQWYVADRFSYRKELTGEEIWIANSLLECLIGEMRNEVINEILDALHVLTESIEIPQANWEILASEFLRFNDNWLIDQSISLLGRTYSAKYVDLIRPFCTNDNPQIAKTANDAIFEIEYVCSKIK
jgi:hypothetical protein